MSPVDAVWYTRCPVPTAFSLALRLGWIDEVLSSEGVAFRSVATALDPEVRRAHFTQQARNLFRHGGNIPVLAARARGADVRVIGLSWTTFYEPILVLPDAPIRDVGDLRGRRLGIPRRTDGETDFWRPTVLRGFAQALSTVGLSLDDVHLVDIPVDRSFLAGTRRAPGERAPLWDAMYMIGQQREEALALLGGQVDAIFSHALLAVNVQGFTGARTLIDVGALPDPARRVNNGTPQVLTVTGDLLAARPDIVARVLAEVVRAGGWAASHDEEARSIIALEAGLAPQLIDVAHSSDLTDELGVSLDDALVSALDEQSRWLSDHGLIHRPVPVDELIAHEPLDLARRLLDGARAGAASP